MQPIIGIQCQKYYVILPVILVQFNNVQHSVTEGTMGVEICIGILDNTVGDAGLTINISDIRSNATGKSHIVLITVITEDAF